jgi:hypothetical protein
MNRCARGCLAGVLVVALSGVLLAQQESKSAPLAKQLGAALDGAKLTAFAVQDPSAPDVFVAAMYYPGSMILVVSAKYAAPSLLVAAIAKREFQGVYLDLQGAPAGNKIFVQDSGADGVTVKGFDSVEMDGKTVTFDGDWKKQKLGSEDEYQKTLATADEQYGRLLNALLTQLSKTP